MTPQADSGLKARPGMIFASATLFQGFIGFLFTILILGRFISLLPEITEDAK